LVQTNSNMKLNSKNITKGLLAGAFTVLVISACNQTPPPAQEPANTEPAKPTAEEMIERGKYMVEIGGCNDCHSPKVFGPQGPVPDPERLLSGHPADEPAPKADPSVSKDLIIMSGGLTSYIGPWGTSFSANLTSDETGIGNWTLEQFTNALRHGLYKGLEGSRPLLPPMPWQGIGQMTDEDMEAVFMYLKSTKPVSNIPPNPIPPAGS